jgi:cytochrome b pre-mRNA-processing protein 3
LIGIHTIAAKLWLSLKDAATHEQQGEQDCDMRQMAQRAFCDQLGESLGPRYVNSVSRRLPHCQSQGGYRYGRKEENLLALRGLRKARENRPAAELYRAAVAAARAPWFYRDLGVPDTLDGRFDLIALHAFLLIHRLQDASAPGPALAQAVFDAMFSDMDVNLREMGVGDLSVGKRVRAMWEGFHGRALAYEPALDAGDEAALAAALARNVWRGAARGEAPVSLARIAQAQAAQLAAQDARLLTTGQVAFLPAARLGLEPAA